MPPRRNRRRLRKVPPPPPRGSGFVVPHGTAPPPPQQDPFSCCIVGCYEDDPQPMQPFEPQSKLFEFTEVGQATPAVEKDQLEALAMKIISLEALVERQAEFSETQAKDLRRLRRTIDKLGVEAARSDDEEDEAKDEAKDAGPTDKELEIADEADDYEETEELEASISVLRR